MNSLQKTDWRAIRRRIEDEKFTPIIGASVFQQFLPSYEKFLPMWAEDIGYPLDVRVNMARLAQFLSVNMGTDLEAKEEFLAFSKRYLFQAIKKSGANGGSESINGKLSDLSYSDMFKLWQRPVSEDDLAHNLRRLAELPIPIYITTSCYNFIELALEEAGKSPRTEICYWNDDLKVADTTKESQTLPVRLRDIIEKRFNLDELKSICLDLNVNFENLPGDTLSAKAREFILYLGRRQRLLELTKRGKELRSDIIDWPDPTEAANRVPSIYAQEPDFQPTADTPLVYHLHGLDLYPSSLVLTEDNYLDFLVKMAWDEKYTLPLPVIQALSDHSLLLLGYKLQDWDFQVLFRGLITKKRRSRTRLSIAIQLTPTTNGTKELTTLNNAQEYLERYFDREKFKIYWGDTQQFIKELWHYWQISDDQ